MVSIGPYTERYDKRHQWDFADLRGCPKPYLPIEGSVMDIINKTPDFSIFRHIVKTAKMEKYLSEQFLFSTVLIPSDEHIKDKISLDFLNNLDIADARNIVMYSCMKRKLDRRYIQSNPSIYFITKNDLHRMYVTTIAGITEFPDCTHVIHWNHATNNGLIHVTDNLLVPNNIPTPL